MDLTVYDALGRAKQRNEIPAASGQFVTDGYKQVTSNISSGSLASGVWSGAFITMTLTGDGVNGMIIEATGFAPYISAGTAAHYEWGICDTTIADGNAIAAQQMPPNAVGITSGVLMVRGYIPPFTGTKSFHLACKSGASNQTITLQASSTKPTIMTAQWATPTKIFGSGAAPAIQWFTPTLLNSWTHYASPYGGVDYGKSPDGNVFVRGLASTAAGTGGSTILTLPAGFRPARTLIFPGLSDAGVRRLDVDTGGNIFFNGAGAINIPWGSLTLNFMAEQ